MPVNLIALGFVRVSLCVVVGAIVCAVFMKDPL